MKSLALAATAAITLAGCAGNFVRPEPSRLTCAPAPVVPDAPVTDEANKDYLIALYGSWENCHNAILWLRDYITKQN
jgi:entry exclusion lipoprotein TrbK